MSCLLKSGAAVNQALRKFTIPRTGITTVHLRPLYLHLTQWGLVPSGLEAAPRRHQLYVDLATPTLVHAAMDIKNAHTSIARQAILLILTHRAHLPAAHSLDRLLLIYFLSYYQNPTVTIIQVARTFEFYLQTDALDQGEALASHLFGWWENQAPLEMRERQQTSTSRMSITRRLMTKTKGDWQSSRLLCTTPQ